MRRRSSGAKRRRTRPFELPENRFPTGEQDVDTPAARGHSGHAKNLVRMQPPGAFMPHLWANVDTPAARGHSGHAKCLPLACGNQRNMPRTCRNALFRSEAWGHLFPKSQAVSGTETAIEWRLASPSRRELPNATSLQRGVPLVRRRILHAPLGPGLKIGTYLGFAWISTARSRPLCEPQAWPGACPAADCQIESCHPGSGTRSTDPDDSTLNERNQRRARVIAGQQSNDLQIAECPSCVDKNHVWRYDCDRRGAGAMLRTLRELVRSSSLPAGAFFDVSERGLEKEVETNVLLEPPAWT